MNFSTNCAYKLVQSLQSLSMSVLVIVSFFRKAKGLISAAKPSLMLFPELDCLLYECKFPLIGLAWNTYQ